MITSRLIVLKMRNISDKTVDKNKTYIPCSKTLIFSRKSCLWRGNVEKFCTTGHATDDNMAHAHCMLYISDCKHTLRIRNTYCSFTATMVTRRHLNVTFTLTLPVFLIIAPSRTIPTPRDLTVIDIRIFCFLPCMNFGLSRQINLKDKNKPTKCTN